MDIKIIEVPQNEQTYIADELERGLTEFVAAGEYSDVVLRELLRLYAQDKPMPNSAVMLLHMCVDDPDMALVIAEPKFGGDDDDIVVDMEQSSVEDFSETDVDGSDYDILDCDVDGGREHKVFGAKMPTKDALPKDKSFDGVRINPLFARVIFDDEHRIRNYGGQMTVLGMANIEQQPYYDIKYGIGGSVAPAEVLLSGSFGPEYYLRLIGNPAARLCKPKSDAQMVHWLQGWFLGPKPGAYVMQLAQATIMELGKLHEPMVQPAAAAPIVSIFADQLAKLGLPDRPMEMARYFGVERSMQQALLVGKWNAQIGEIVERRRQLARDRGAEYTAGVAAGLEATLRMHTAIRLFGRVDDLTAKQTGMIDGEVARTLKQIAGQQVPKWAAALAKFHNDAGRDAADGLSNFFDNYNLKTSLLTDPDVDDRWAGDWIRDAEGMSIICPHVWYRRRYGETMRTFEVLETKFATHKAQSQAEETINGWYCKLCGDLIAKDDNIDFQSFERLEPDRDQKDLVYRFTLLAKTWLDFKPNSNSGDGGKSSIESTSFRRIISGACGAISPIVQDVRKNLRKIRTLSDIEFEQLYDFYTGVVIFAMFILLVRDNKSRIFIRPVREKFVYKDVETKSEVIKVADKSDKKVDKSAADKAVAETDRENADLAENVADVIVQPDVASEIDSDLVEDMDGAYEVDNIDGAYDDLVGDIDAIDGTSIVACTLVDARTLTVGGAQRATGSVEVHKWAVAAVQQQYRETIVAMPDLTKDVIINRLNNAFAKLSTVISSAMLVKTEYITSAYVDEISEKLAKYALVDMRKASADVLDALAILQSARNGKFMRKSVATPVAELDIGGLGAVMVKREPPPARPLDKGDKTSLSFMYGRLMHAANAKLLEGSESSGFSSKATAGGSVMIPHIHAWNIYKVRRGAKFEYVKAPGGSTILDRYCSICAADWSHGHDDGGELFDKYYEADSFFNYYTSNCPVFDDGHHYHMVKGIDAADAECKCGISRQKLSRRDAGYYSKYIAEFRKIHLEVKLELTISTVDAVVLKPNANSGANNGHLEIDMKTFVAQTYVAYSAVDTKIKQDQYINIFTDLGLSSACTWGEFLAGSARGVIDGSIISLAAKQRRVFKTETFGVAELTQLNKYAQLVLSVAVMIANYRNLAKQDADIVAIGELLDKGYKLPAYRGETLIHWRRVTAEAAMPALLRDYTMWMIVEVARSAGKAAAAIWIAYIVGKIVETERAWALLSEEEQASISARGAEAASPQVAVINSADNEVVNKISRKDLAAADAEENEENVYDGMDYDGQNDDND